MLGPFLRISSGAGQETDRLNALSLESITASKLLRKDEPMAGLRYYAALYMAAAKQSIRWAWRKELIQNLPRNIDDSDLAILATQKKLRLFSKEELKVLFAFTTERQNYIAFDVEQPG